MSSETTFIRSTGPVEAKDAIGASPDPSPIVPAPTFSRVLVCTDFSSASNLAVKEAVRLAKATSANLLLLHVLEYEVVSAHPEEDRDSSHPLPQGERQQLTDLLDEVRGNGVTAEAILRDGPAAQVILDMIVDRGVDLAVLGSHGFSGLERMVFGSIAESVIRKSSCPVLTIGPRAVTCRCQDAQHPGPVIFATDFQRPTATAVRYAAALAKLDNAALHCLHVLPLSLENDAEPSVVPHIMMEALRHLAESEPVCTSKPVCATTYGSEVSHAIVDYAKAQAARLIVLGVRRASLLASHLPAHVTYRIIATAPCPVLTVLFDHD